MKCEHTSTRPLHPGNEHLRETARLLTMTLSGRPSHRVVAGIVLMGLDRDLLEIRICDHCGETVYDVTPTGKLYGKQPWN